MVCHSSGSSSLSSNPSSPSSSNPSPSRTVSPAPSPSQVSPPPNSSKQQSKKSTSSSSTWSTKKAASSIGKYRRDDSGDSHKLSLEPSKSKKGGPSLSKDSQPSEKLRRSTRPKVTYEDALAEAVAGMRKKKALSAEKSAKKSASKSKKADEKRQPVKGIVIIPLGRIACNNKDQFSHPNFTRLRNGPLHIKQGVDGTPLSFSITLSESDMFWWLRHIIPSHILTYLSGRASLENLDPPDPFIPMKRHYNEFTLLDSNACRRHDGKFVSGLLKHEHKSSGEIYLLSNAKIPDEKIALWTDMAARPPIPSRMGLPSPSPKPSKQSMPVTDSEDDSPPATGKGKGKSHSDRPMKRCRKSPTPPVTDSDSDHDLALALEASRQDARVGRPFGEGSGSGAGPSTTRNLRPRPRPRPRAQQPPQEIINVDDMAEEIPAEVAGVPVTAAFDDDPFDLTYPNQPGPLTRAIPNSPAYPRQFVFSDEAEPLD